MRLRYTAFIMLISITTNAQSSLLRSPGISTLNRPDQEILFDDRDVIWQEDFSDGIDGWTTSEPGNVAAWEYRGLTTNPNNEVGSRGSCSIDNLGDPILSPTWTNGFMIFDSNWWDNPDNPCSPDNFGTGPAPAPHLAILTSPAIDLTNNFSVALVFNQYQKMFTGETRVELSYDAFNWFTIFTNPSTPNPTNPDDQQIIQISQWAAGQPVVFIRFVFDGFYYYWQIDDICILDTYANDLALLNSTYGDFDLSDPAHPTGYEYMEYTRYPVEMPPQLKFSSTCYNQGALTQSDCRLNVVVQENETGTAIHTGQSEEGLFIGSGDFQELRAGDFQMPGDVGSYRVIYNTSQTESEEFEANNVDSMLFFIHDVQYARDNLFASAVYLGIPEYANVQYELGNVFLITADGMACHSISVGVGIGSSAPTSIYGAIYEFDITEGVNATLLATTPSLSITQDMFNAYGDQMMTNLTFDVPVAVNAGSAYFVAVGSTDGVDDFVCAMAGSADEATAFVKYYPSDWYYLDMKPMVRMNFGLFDAVEESSGSSSMLEVFPVPANDKIWIRATDWNSSRSQVEIYDETGRQVYSQLISTSGDQLTCFDVNFLSRGVYEIFLRSEGRIAHARFTKQ